MRAQWTVALRDGRLTGPSGERHGSSVTVHCDCSTLSVLQGIPQGGDMCVIESEMLGVPRHGPSRHAKRTGEVPRRVPRAGFTLGSQDLYVNIAGGVRVSEPAADLGVISALASAAYGRALDDKTVVIGEVGLSGEIRAVSRLEARLREAQGLGFSRCLVPQIEIDRGSGASLAQEMVLEGVSDLSGALAKLGIT